MVIWPVAMPLTYIWLLYRCRHDIRSHQPTTLSRATRFLWLEYDDAYYWYEMVLLGQKLLLTNVLLFINFDSGGSDKLLRVFIGLLIALLGLTLQLVTQPFRKQTDGSFNCLVQLMLVLFFVLGALVKLCDTDDACATDVGMASAYNASAVMVCAGLVVVLVPAGMVIRQLLYAQGIPGLRDARTMEPPELLLGADERYHLFLSHVWGTGQDQCAVIKRQLQLLLPRIIVFLDVDDLKDIGDLESYVNATSVMLFFLSRNYFQSRNCLREINATLEQEKPIVLVHEQQEDKGGGPLDMLKAECHSDEMRAKIFEGRIPITWHRISHYQRLTLTLISTEMLRHGPRYGSDKQGLKLILPGAVNVSELVLPRPLVLWCSTGNTGSAEIAQELLTAMARGGAALQVVDSQPDMQALQADGVSACMLLYLNKGTWVEHGDALEKDVRAARAAGLKLILVHENDSSKGGCDFGAFFATTPQELINQGLYSDIAIALHTPPHRAVSLALVAQAVGAIKATTKLGEASVSGLQKALSRRRSSASKSNMVEVVASSSHDNKGEESSTPV